MDWLKAHRLVVIVVTAVFVAAICGIIVWFLALPSNDDGLSMGDYGPDKQRDWAQQLVAGLNSHDADQVPVGDVRGKHPASQKRTIVAAMPAPHCRYELVSVEDRGEQGVQDVPGLTGQRSTYLFDMTVKELCGGQQTGTREIGVMAVADMGYWNPYYFVTV